MAHVTEQDCTYEIEYTGEVGLHERQQVCRKNLKHKSFFPINRFTQKDLPNGYQTDEIMKVIKTIADLTVRIRVSYTSMSRPTIFPETDQVYVGAELRGCSIPLVGTGFIGNVRINNGRDGPNGLEHCPCYSCKSSKIPHIIWGQVSIVTAAHVVCTPDEVVHAEIDCFYNDDEDSDTKVKVLSGNTMRASKNPITKVSFADDFCQFFVITHDINLCEQLYKYNLYDLMTLDLGVESSANTALTVIVSHPHGCPKCVTWGEWRSVDILNDPDGPEKHRYRYNTQTCPGSSGALVWLLETSQNKWQKIFVHSAGLSNGLNISGTVEMFRELVTSAVNCHIS